MDLAVMSLSWALVTVAVAVVIGSLSSKASKAQAGEATALVLIAKLEAERSILIAQNAALTDRLQQLAPRSISGELEAVPVPVP